jgi:hypothetical protein
MRVIVTKSQFKEDKDLPWTYNGTGFKQWVWEVLLDMGKAGRFPRNVSEAVDVAVGAGFEITIE